MTMSDWARREIKIFSQSKDNYDCMCAESALKAFLSLCEDGHSGFSWSITTKILRRLTDGLPLTQIEDKDFLDQDGMVQEDPRYLKEKGLKSVLQCKRMTRLFRYETKNGEVTYSDVERTVCFDEGKDIGFSSGIGSRLVDKMFPIKMPYFPPTEKYVVMFRNDKPIWIMIPEGEKVFLSDSEHLDEAVNGAFGGSECEDNRNKAPKTNEKPKDDKSINETPNRSVRPLKSTEKGKSVLDEGERKYLEAVLAPFKEKYAATTITKTATKYRTAYICIALIEKGKKDECHEEIALPYFDRDKMYKGMEADRKYALEELGL